MKLSDLKTGMWVKTRNGDMSLVMRDHVSISSSDGIFIDKCGYFEFKEYNDDMTDREFTEYDIIEVLIPDLEKCSLNGVGLISIWKRRELPELTPFEKEILKALRLDFKNGWIIRDKDGEIYVHSNKPVKLHTMWQSDGVSNYISSIVFHPVPFCWASWEDEEPWYIPDLIKEE